MKLYAIIENKKGKKEGVGDNSVLKIELSNGNRVVGKIFFDGDGAIFTNITTGKEYETIFTKSKHIHEFFSQIGENNEGCICGKLKAKSKKANEERCISCNKIPDILGRCKCCNKDAY